MLAARAGFSQRDSFHQLFHSLFPVLFDQFVNIHILSPIYQQDSVFINQRWLGININRHSQS